MPDPPDRAASELRGEMLELLKLLNRAEEEQRDVDGYEFSELHHFLARGPCPQIGEPEVQTALRVLVANRFASELSDPEYAWDRARVVGRRFAITTEGKEFLLRQLERTGRID